MATRIADYKKGHLIFTLEGEKLRGRWHLVRMHGRGGEKKEPWLLIKAKDDEARNPDDPDILEDKPLSVVSGRSIPEIAEGKGRKRVWHSNRSVKDNVTGGATKANASVRRASTSKTSAKASHTEWAPPTSHGSQEEEPPRNAPARAAKRSRGRKVRPCRISCRRRSPPCARRHRAGRAGCMRSSSTAIGSRPGSTAARSACSPARVSTGPANSPTSPRPSPNCRRAPRSSTGRW